MSDRPKKGRGTRLPRSSDGDACTSMSDTVGSKDIFIPIMRGSIDHLMDKMNKKARRDPKVVKKAFEVLIGLSLKGYEGKSVGTIFLIGDMEGVRRNTNQLIANPFKGYYKRINIMDPKNRRTVEAYTQLDGAIVIDGLGNLSSAGRVIDIKGERGPPGSDPHGSSRRGGGTRDRASQYITTVSNTLALTLSCDGDLTVYERGKCLGKILWGVRVLGSEEDLYCLFEKDQ